MPDKSTLIRDIKEGNIRIKNRRDFGSNHLKRVNLLKFSVTLNILIKLYFYNLNFIFAAFQIFKIFLRLLFYLQNV